MFSSCCVPSVDRWAAASLMGVFLGEGSSFLVDFLVGWDGGVRDGIYTMGTLPPSPPSACYTRLNRLCELLMLWDSPLVSIDGRSS